MRAAILSVLGSVVVTFLAAACGSSDDGAHDAPDAAVGNDATAPDPGSDGAVDAGMAYPAAHPPMPQVITAGGPTLAKPRVIPIYFTGYDYASQVGDYLSKLGASDFWKANVSEYGVGALTAGEKIEVDETPPAKITDAQIQVWLASMLDGSHPTWGTADTTAIYTIFYPTQTVISLTSGGGDPPDGGAPDSGAIDSGADDATAAEDSGADDDASIDAGIADAGGFDGGDGGTHRGGQVSCQAFGGYHGNIVLNGKAISYAVIPECPTFGNLNGVDVITATTSHELIEAVTDPYPYDDPAYETVDGDHGIWAQALGGGETGDMCAQFDDSFVKEPTLNYFVQRSWSNAAAKGGHNPCVPAPAGEVYFNSAPDFKDRIALSSGATTLGAKIPVGSSKTIELTLFSDGPTEPWTIAANELKRSQTAADTLSFAFDKTTGVNGDKIQMTITAVAASTSRSKTSSFIVSSKLGSRSNLWIGAVTN